MKLTKKHIGGLFDVDGGDGSWCYQLIDVTRKDLLFYKFDGKYYIEARNKYHDWRKFIPKKFPKTWIKTGWNTGIR
jgi:hypothetical protein